MNNDLIMLVSVDGQKVVGEDVATGEPLTITVTPERAEVLKAIMAEAGTEEGIDYREVGREVQSDSVEPESPAYLTREGFMTEVVE
ncbi:MULTISPECIES: hypothetical protein [Lacticaseibacillus]|uniref:Uncharacterized protein n=1 Tax=Lacticaseibacillus camelliae DSM 22697 = JCM 13995 TaxID=1423730 RepID=A0A0R2F707_9LACO|nr:MULTISPECIES: hypothetical protein [Lacticaseibacillus]KRN24152.1 hypothetical protein FC75_GL001330 [Lacticaseibacillus camelliae DSM 22697 = JCM 13995]